MLELLRVEGKRDAHRAQRLAGRGRGLAADGLRGQGKAVQLVIFFDDDKRFGALPARHGQDLRETAEKAEDHAVIPRPVCALQQIAGQGGDIGEVLRPDGLAQHVQRGVGDVGGGDRVKIRAQRCREASQPAPRVAERAAAGQLRCEDGGELPVILAARVGVLHEPDHLRRPRKHQSSSPPYGVQTEKLCPPAKTCVTATRTP